MSDKQLIQNLKGFRDFLGKDKRERDFLMLKFIEVFQKYGFEPLETPTLEYAELLLGKYGDEADKLVYSFEDRGGRKVALRYDQTVPTTRVLTQYQNDLPKYYRRYQIQNVFRADKPQKGRYREFTQCDIDILGSRSSLSDAEILACTYECYVNAGFKTVKLLVNDRKVLIETLSKYATEDVDVFSIIQSIDKLDKMSGDKVTEELVEKGLDKAQAEAALADISKAEISPELKKILNDTRDLGVPEDNLVFTSTLARGLDYYTGMIVEVMSPDYNNGSLGAGGRYDNLVEQLGGQSIPAVGFSIGFDRTLDAMNDLDLLPDFGANAEILVTVFDSTKAYCLELAKELREAGISTEVYANEADDLGKQLKYADQIKVKYTVIAGDNEAGSKSVVLKKMETGEQIECKREELLDKLND